MKNNKTILIVEDEVILARLMQMMLQSKGYNVVGSVSTAEDAINACRNQSPDLVLMDIFIRGEMNGIEAVNTIRQFSNPFVIYVTGNSDIFTKEQANDTKPSAYLIKPVNANTLFRAVQQALAAA
jgi:two-component system, response regulator PdtaR